MEARARCRVISAMDDRRARASSRPAQKRPQSSVFIMGVKAGQTSSPGDGGGCPFTKPAISPNILRRAMSGVAVGGGREPLPAFARQNPDHIEHLGIGAPLVRVRRKYADLLRGRRLCKALMGVAAQLVARIVRDDEVKEVQSRPDQRAQTIVVRSHTTLLPMPRACHIAEPTSGDLRRRLMW